MSCVHFEGEEDYMTSLSHKFVFLLLTVFASVALLAQHDQAAGKQPPKSPPAEASVSVNGKTISIKYSSPSVKGRQIFGPGGLISHDPNYPVWRAGANAATALHTDADLQIKDLSVPKGDYTLFVDVSNPDAWTLVVSKDTGEWGLAYKKDKDLGRVAMDMSKPSAPVEQLKYTLAEDGSGKAKLTLAWENHEASVPITVK
jgi:hypothetical protein